MRESHGQVVATHATARELFEVTIERILPGGRGLAHADGRTLMVALAAPGDRLLAQVERTKGSVGFASIVQIIEPSPVRVEPPCPYFGRCGGCDFQQLNYQAQLDAKVAIIRDCLHRIARIDPVPDFEIVPAPNQWHYRARAQWQYDSRQKWLGYFEANSHTVCDVAECAVLVPELQSELEDLRASIADGSQSDDTRYFRAIAGDENAVVAAGGGRRRWGASPTVTEGPGSDEVARTISGESYRLNAESFFQTNMDLLPQLIDYALGEVSGNRAIELYCGVGLFTLPLARRFKNVIGVEDGREATGFARQNLTTAGLTNADVVSRDVADWLEENFECAGVDGAEFLLLDPPRTGAESRVINGIVKLKPQRICYVSCDPATLARDVRKLSAGGYRIDRIRAFDMFPQTHHVETIVQLTM